MGAVQQNVQWATGAVRRPQLAVAARREFEGEEASRNIVDGVERSTMERCDCAAVSRRTFLFKATKVIDNVDRIGQRIETLIFQEYTSRSCDWS